MRWKEFKNILRSSSHIDRILGCYKSEEFCSLVERWNFGNPTGALFKTDLREEAGGSDQILFSLGYPQESVYGVDKDHATVLTARSKAQEKSLTHRYLTGDVRALPFKNGTFDLIISSSTLDHFTSDEEFAAALSEVARVMNEKGILVLAVNNRSNFCFRWMVALGEMTGLIGYPNRFFRKRTLQDFCEKAGLKIEKTDYIVHIISPLNTLFLFLRRFMPAGFVDFLAKVAVEIFMLLGAHHNTTPYTGWFIAVKCRKSYRQAPLSTVIK